MGVLIRMIVVCCVAVLCGACANERSTAALAVQPMSAANASPRVESAAGATERDIEMRQAAKQTIAGKVLAAIALERVTGRKPDPQRLVELR